MNYWRVPREWEGETAFIIGGGPSLTRLGHDRLIPRLYGRHPVIAVNNAYELAPWAEVLWWADTLWLQDNWTDLHRHVGWYKVTRQRAALKNVSKRLVPDWLKWVKTLRCKSQAGLSLEPDTICGRHGGHHAINLAVLFGVKRIVLLGYDLHRREPAGYNWHNRHKRPTPAHNYGPVYRADLEATAPLLKAAGVEVLNGNPQSALRCFPFADPWDLL